MISRSENARPASQPQASAGTTITIRKTGSRYTGRSYGTSTLGAIVAGDSPRKSCRCQCREMCEAMRIEAPEFTRGAMSPAANAAMHRPQRRYSEACSCSGTQHATYSADKTRPYPAGAARWQAPARSFSLSRRECVAAEEAVELLHVARGLVALLERFEPRQLGFNEA